MMGHIPPETTSFVGRGPELALLAELLATERLITVTGVGGVGKTRLARRAAARAAGRFPDGVWWADLSTLTDADLLLATIGDACGLSDHSPRMPAQVLCEWLAGKQLLLVLDSCEHLLEDCLHAVGEILTAAPGVRVLATSRRPLGSHAETVLELEPLPAGGEDALTLFAARVAEPDALRQPGAGEVAAALCRRVEGIPLAIELAAAQVGPASVTEVSDRLGSRLEVLTRSDFVWPRRHQALRTTIGWSHELCAPLERLLWARLSVFHGPFHPDCAAKVTSGGPLAAEHVPKLLESLVRQSVLGRESGGRYRMLGVIREYGQEWLRELGEADRLAERHIGYVVRLVRWAEANWLTGAQLQCYRKVEEIHADVRIALDRMLATDPARAADTLGRLVFFWTCCGRVQAATSYLERALAAHREPGPERTRAVTALGVTLTLRGEYARAAVLGREAVAAATGANDTEARFAAVYLTGLLALLTGRPREALRRVEEALTAAPGFALESASRLRCHLVKVFALTALGEVTDAHTLALGLREHCALTDEVWTRSYLDYQLSLIALSRSAPGEAAHHARLMLRGKQDLGDTFGIALGLDLLAAALAADGHTEAAASAYGTSATLWRSVGHPQRGTPELKAIRTQCEATARAALGNAGYTRAYDRGAANASHAAVAALVEGGGS